MAITAVLVSAFVAYGVNKSMNNSNTELSELTLANLEVLAQDEGGGGNINCSLNVYKKWFGTTNIPSNRKEYFTDCQCNPKEGYDPQACTPY